MDKDLLYSSILKGTAFSFARSGGHGGQNVNKVNTKVYAHIPITALKGLSETELKLVRQRLANNINQNQELFISIQDERVQGVNRQIALERMLEWIERAAIIPKKRKKTKPTASSKEDRIKIKKIHATVKRFRHSVSIHDD